MSNPPFFRPMFAGFAITAGAMLVLPIEAKAEAPAVHADAASCDAPAPKSRRFNFGRLLSAAQRSGMTQLLTGGAMGGSNGGLVAGAVARTAIEAAAQAPGTTPVQAPAGAATETAGAACAAPAETN